MESGIRNLIPARFRLSHVSSQSVMPTQEAAGNALFFNIIPTKSSARFKESEGVFLVVMRKFTRSPARAVFYIFHHFSKALCTLRSKKRPVNFTIHHELW